MSNGVQFVQNCDLGKTDQKILFKAQVDVIWNSKSSKEQVEKALNYVFERANCSKDAEKEIFNFAQNRGDAFVHEKALGFLMEYRKYNQLTVKLVVDVVYGTDKKAAQKIECMKWLIKYHKDAPETIHTMESFLRASVPANDDSVKAFLLNLK